MAGATIRRAEAGKAVAESIIQTVHLFYQNNTALSYYVALTKRLTTELKRREEEVHLDKLRERVKKKKGGE